MQQLPEKNLTKLSPPRWERVTTTFVKLFRTTAPHQLFDESLRVEILRNDTVYTTMPPDQLLRLMGVLDHSYQFARMFNDDRELRTGLWKVGMCSKIISLSPSHFLLPFRFYATSA